MTYGRHCAKVSVSLKTYLLKQFAAAVYLFEAPPQYTVKKVYIFSRPQPLTKLFPARESLVSDIPAGDGKTANLFLQCVRRILDRVRRSSVGCGLA
jgi:hypothetical protein